MIGTFYVIYLFRHIDCRSHLFCNVNMVTSLVLQLFIFFLTYFDDKLVNTDDRITTELLVTVPKPKIVPRQCCLNLFLNVRNKLDWEIKNKPFPVPIFKA